MLYAYREAEDRHWWLRNTGHNTGASTCPRLMGHDSHVRSWEQLVTGILCCGFCRTTDSPGAEKSESAERADALRMEAKRRRKRRGGGLTNFITAAMGTSAGNAPMVGTSASAF